MLLPRPSIAAGGGFGKDEMGKRKQGRPAKDKSDKLTARVTIHMTRKQKAKWLARVRAAEYFCQSGNELGRRLLLEGGLNDRQAN